MTATFTAGQTLTAVQTNTDLANPTGMLAPFAGSTQPTGWLLCDGTSKTSAAYPDLFAVIGYTYGGSAGTFYLPDMRGRIPMGAGTGAGQSTTTTPLSGTGIPTGGNALTARARGDWGGEETHLLTGAESGTSAHGHTASSPAHTHGPGSSNTFLTWDGGTLGVASGGGLAQAVGSPATTAATAATVNVANSTAANASSRAPVIAPFVVLNYIIKT